MKQKIQQVLGFLLTVVFAITMTFNLPGQTASATTLESQLANLAQGGTAIAQGQCYQGITLGVAQSCSFPGPDQTIFPTVRNDSPSPGYYSLSTSGCQDCQYACIYPPQTITPGQCQYRECNPSNGQVSIFNDGPGAIVFSWSTFPPGSPCYNPF